MKTCRNCKHLKLTDIKNYSNPKESVYKCGKHHFGREYNVESRDACEEDWEADSLFKNKIVKDLQDAREKSVDKTIKELECLLRGIDPENEYIRR